MLMVCPRCGLEQPKDQYCASCGLNVDAFRAKPIPLWKRIVQNPNVHLSLIGLLIMVVVGWIFYTQSEIVSREVGQFLDMPLASKDAADPNEVPRARANPVTERAQPAQAPPPAAMENQAASLTADSDKTADAGAAVAAAPTNVEVIFLEVPRDTLTTALALGKRVANGTGGQAYYFAQDNKVADTLTSQGESLGATVKTPIAASTPILLETQGAEPFKFELTVGSSRREGKDPSVRFEANMTIPAQDTVVLEGSVRGANPLTPQGVLVVVVEPPQRSISDEVLLKAGAGPWEIFSSPRFRNSLSDWVIVIQLK
jgi:hypothetical protein